MHTSDTMSKYYYFHFLFHLYVYDVRCILMFVGTAYIHIHIIHTNKHQLFIINVCTDAGYNTDMGNDNVFGERVQVKLV